MAVTRLWPVAEAAQADYETLRAAVVAGTPMANAVAARFVTGGLLSLIRRPVAEPVFSARILGAPRPPWTPYADPRLEALVGAYQLVLTVVPSGHRYKETGS